MPAAGSGSPIQHGRGELTPHCSLFCFLLQTAHSHPLDLTGIIQTKLEMGRGNTHIGILALMGEIIGVEDKEQVSESSVTFPYISSGETCCSTGPTMQLQGPWVWLQGPGRDLLPVAMNSPLCSHAVLGRHTPKLCTLSHWG